MKKLNFREIAFLIFAFAFSLNSANAQTTFPTPPPPSAPRPVKIPNVQETTLPNGLRVAVIERKNVPLVTATLLVSSGASKEYEKSGLANMTASLLLKGTKTRSATQIAEEIEFLGGNINTGANWLNSNVSVNTTSDKIEQALAVMADTVINPTFAQNEFDLLKNQVLDGINVALKQPSTIANFAAARYTFGEHNPTGTPESLAKITRQDIIDFYTKEYTPKDSVLIFVGDISQTKADELAKKLFGNWTDNSPPSGGYGSGIGSGMGSGSGNLPTSFVRRILVIDLPNSGQAAVTYTKRLGLPRTGTDYYPAIVTNAVLGGGYSSRLNMEIRLKRGLSYGAGSNFAWRENQSNFSTRGQTKNESAAEVAELTIKEIEKMETGAIESPELIPRKLALTGGFGREVSTNNSLTQRLIELYTFDLKPEFFGSYIADVEKISDANVKSFVSTNLKGGDLIIVGDYKIFADDLKKRFPNQTVEVIPASQLDLNSQTLRK